MPARRLLLLTEDNALAALLPPQLAQGTEFHAEALPPAQAPERLRGTGDGIEALLLDSAAAPGPAHWLASLGAAWGRRPVLVLGAAAETAAPWLPKPIRLTDLVVRLRGLLAAFDASPEASIALGGARFHALARRLDTAGGDRIRLTEKEAAILLHLHRAGGRSVPRSELLDEVWGYSQAVTTHTLETHVYRLRRKIERGTAAGPRLVTEEGGYRLEVPPLPDS